MVIENCPQIKKLNVRKNLLTSLEFLKDLENLEELEIDCNAELIKILEPYDGDWKDYQKDLKKSNKDNLELLRNIRVLEKEKKDLSLQLEFSQQKYNELKKFFKEKTFALLSQKAKQGLVNELKKRINRKESLSAPGMTKELMLNTEAVIESAKELKKDLEEELKVKSDKIQELEKENEKAEERRITTLLIPVEKLDAAYRDIGKFLSEWDQNRLDKLKTSQQLKKYKLVISGTQWTSRVASVVGGALLFVGANEENQNNPYTQTGGIIAITAPFAEIVASQWEKSCEDNEEEWRSFVKDTESIWYTYRDLERIILNINENYVIEGEVKEAFKILKKNIEEFAEKYKKYDTNKDGKIDDEEWKEARDDFSQDLKNKWEDRKKELKQIKEATEKLRERVSNYRNDDEIVSQAKTKSENKDHQIIDLDKHFKEKETQLKAQIQIPPK